MVIAPQFNRLYISNEDGLFQRSPLHVIECEVIQETYPNLSRIKTKIVGDYQVLDYLHRVVSDNSKRDLLIEPNQSPNGNSLNCLGCVCTSFEYSTFNQYSNEFYSITLNWICRDLEVVTRVPQELAFITNIANAIGGGLAEQFMAMFDRIDRGFNNAYETKEEMPVLDWHKYGF